jgi:hypothetical protein
MAILLFEQAKIGVHLLNQKLAAYAESLQELRQTTDRASYEASRPEKRASGMPRRGYDATAARATVSHPLSTLGSAIAEARTKTPVTRRISTASQRSSAFAFPRRVEHWLSDPQRKKGPLPSRPSSIRRPRRDRLRAL